MKMHVVEQRNAMFDRGRNHMGATFDSGNVYLMSHPNSMPVVHLDNVLHYDQLAQALEPYAAEAQSHFWFGTVQHVLTLYDTLPSHVPIVVAWSQSISSKFHEVLNLNMSRFVPFDPSATYSAARLYSVMYQPWSRDLQGGEPVSPQSMKRLMNHMRPVPVQDDARRTVVLVSRKDRASRNCVNHAELLVALRGHTWKKDIRVVEFTGTSMSTQQAQSLFANAEMVVAPHGGALLNIVFMRPGTSVVEIGYHETNATNYRSMRFPPWYFVMAKLLNMSYSLVMAPGAYNAHINCPIDEVLDAVKKQMY